MIGRALHLARRVREAHRNGARVSARGVIDTIRLSVQATGRPWYEFPVIVAGPTVVRVSHHASIEVDPDSRLVLGMGATQQIFDVDRVRSALVMLPRSRLHVSDGRVRLGWGTKVRIARRASLVLGGGSFINANCLIIANTSVTIGQRCSVAWRTTIMDADYHLVASGRPRSAPVEIGSDVWVGTESIIMQGTSIGSGAVVAARSVVRGVVPERALVAGLPARVVRRDVSWQV